MLVPLDGTPFAEHALPLALAIARRSGAAIRLFHVHSSLESSFEPIEFQLNSGFDYWHKQRQRTYLERSSRRMARASSATAMPILREAGDNIASAIAVEANAAADLIVMATHRRSRFGRWWNGSVAESLLRETSIPVLLVRGRNTSPDLADAPPLQRVLIPVDGSPEAEEALEPALALGDAMDAEYTLLRIASDAPDQLLVLELQTKACGNRETTRRGAELLASLLRRLSRRGQSTAQLRRHTRKAFQRQRHSLACADAKVRPHRSGDSWPRRHEPLVAKRGVADAVIRNAATPVLAVRARA